MKKLLFWIFLGYLIYLLLSGEEAVDETVVRPPIPEDIPTLFLGSALEQARKEGHLLAEPDYQQLKYAMWDAYENYFLYKAKAVQARRHLQASFSWQQAALKFADWIKTL